MALSLSPKIKLPYLFANQTQKEVTVNEALAILDAMVCATTPEWGITAAPTTPANGDLYVIPADGTGTWAGKAGQVTWYSEGWKFSNPIKGLRVLDISTKLEYICDGTDWLPGLSGGGGASLVIKKVGGSNSVPTTLAFSADDFEYAYAGGVGTLTRKVGATGIKASQAGTPRTADMIELDFLDGFTVTQKAGPTGVGKYTVAYTGTPALALAVEGVEVEGDGAATLNFGEGFEIEHTEGGYYSITFTGGGGAAIGLAADGENVPATGGVVTKLNFNGATITPTAGGYMTIDFDSIAANMEIASAGTVKTTPANLLDFAAGFTVTEKTGAGNEGKYEIAYTGASNLAMAVDNVNVAGAGAFKLNFGSNFEVAQRSGTPGLYDILMTGAPADITFKLSGETVAGTAASFMDFGPGFEIEQTTPGYYSINFAGGSSVELAAGGVDVPAKDEGGTAAPGNPVTKINFNGATITPSDGGYMTISLASGDAAEKSVKKHTTTPATIQVDGFANQVVTLGANWAPQLSLAANHPGEKIGGYLYIIQDATGGRTVTWPGNVFWDGGVAPVISLAPGKMDIFYFETISDDALHFIGSMVGGNITAPTTITTV